MQRKLFGAFLIALAIVGVTFFQSTPRVAAEYACGTYGANDFGNDCPDDTTTTTTPAPASTPTNSPSDSPLTVPVESSPQASPSSSGDTPTTAPSTTSTASNPVATAASSQQVNKTQSSHPYNWWPLIIVGTVMVIAITAVITYRLRKTH